MTDRALSIALWALAALAALAFMEAWAALLHGRVWHALLWPLHRSHHRPRRGRFEANDLLSVTHAPVALGLILYGCVGPAGPARDVAYGWGIGMSAFGLLYFTFHDGLVHGRLPVQGLLRFRLVRLWKHAHLAHHRRGREPYGFFYVPKGLRDELRAKVERPDVPPAPHHLRDRPRDEGARPRCRRERSRHARPRGPGAERARPQAATDAPAWRAPAPPRQAVRPNQSALRTPRRGIGRGLGRRPHCVYCILSQAMSAAVEGRRCGRRRASVGGPASHGARPPFAGT
jgi:beta-carotene 3-hydroxylase